MFRWWRVRKARKLLTLLLESDYVSFGDDGLEISPHGLYELEQMANAVFREIYKMAVTV